jgi:hypothetical protein
MRRKQINQLWRDQDLPRRRDGQRDGKKPQDPIPSGVLEKLRRIRAPVAAKPLPHQQAQRTEAGQKYNYLRPFTCQNRINSLDPFITFFSGSRRARCAYRPI